MWMGEWQSRFACLTAGLTGTFESHSELLDVFSIATFIPNNTNNNKISVLVL